MIPTRQEAERLLREAERRNPGPWGNHSRVAAHCAEKIAAACEGMDAEKAYILGLLHDIGRKFGGRHLGHVSDGYTYMMSLGYDEAARICLTHSFNNMTTDEYIGKFDTTGEELALIRTELSRVAADDYDRLIQLCDSLAGSGRVMNIEDRMNDVRRRYGNYPQPKWDSNMRLKAYFEEKAGTSIYDLVEKDTFQLSEEDPDTPPLSGYVCKIADPGEMNRKWDDEISRHAEKENWIAWKSEAIESARMGRSIPYYGILDGTIICEATAVLKPGCGQAAGETEPAVELCAFRTNKEYRGQGYFSRLMRFVQEDLKRKGYRKAIVGVEPDEKRNREIYRHWGFTELVSTGTETYPDGTVIRVEFYGKQL